jgi:hypothetical protein
MRVNVLVRIVGLSLVATTAGAQVMTKEAMLTATANFRLNPTLTIGMHATNDVYVPVRVSWNAYPGTGATYTAAWSASASGPWHAFPGDLIRATSVSVYVLPDKLYYVRVAVLYGTTRDSTGAATADATGQRPNVGIGSQSGSSFNTIGVPGLHCTAASGLVTLTWTGIPHAAGYRVSEKGNTNTTLQSWDAPATSWSGRPLSPSDPTTTIWLGLSGVMYTMPGGSDIWVVGLATYPFQTTIAKLNASQCP